MGRMSRWLNVAMAVALAAGMLGNGATQAQVRPSGLFDDDVLRSHGLERAWSIQLSFDRSRDRLNTLTIAGGMILAQTERGLIQVLDAETGQTFWRTHLGRQDFPTLPPAATDRHVAVINGATLFLLDAKTGNPIWERVLRQSPSAPPAINDKRVYVLSHNSFMSSYLIDTTPTQSKAKIDKNLAINYRLLNEQPWTVRSVGIPSARPTLAGGAVAWGTSRGLVYVSEDDEARLRYEIATGAGVVSSLAYRAPLFYIASLNRELYAVHEESGADAWRFPAAGPLTEPPVVMDDQLFVLSRGAGLYCLDALTGAQRWFTRGPERFVAASPSRLYGADELGTIYVLNRRTGARIDTIAAQWLTVRCRNEQNDRVYLARPNGMVQCLREEGRREPSIHAPAPPPPAGGATEGASGGASAAPAEGDAAAGEETTAGEEGAADSPADPEAAAEPPAAEEASSDEAP